MDKPKIVLFSGFAQHGKDTSADFMIGYLEQFNLKCLKISYGDYLKFVAEKYYGWNGKKDEAGRELLQQIGTEWARDFHPDIWVNVVVENIKAFGHLYDYVVIPDFRYRNEYSRWKDEGYDNVFTVWVHRQGFDNGLTQKQKNHRSETSLLDFSFHRIISVPSDLNVLANGVFDITREWVKDL